ncbi:MAG: hypothetical protein KGQ56_04370, partial [Acidobacteria bacterium]|nr:hypothetical protein [Acidobacteriota bacterium]
AELSEVVVFESVSVDLVKMTTLATGLRRFEIPTPEFSFYEVSVSQQNMLIDINLPGDAILLCVSGSIAVSNSQEEREVIQTGEAAFIAGDARTFSMTGSGFGYLVIGSN